MWNLFRKNDTYKEDDLSRVIKEIFKDVENCPSGYYPTLYKVDFSFNGFKFDLRRPMTIDHWGLLNDTTSQYRYHWVNLGDHHVRLIDSILKPLYEKRRELEDDWFEKNRLKALESIKKRLGLDA